MLSAAAELAGNSNGMAMLKGSVRIVPLWRDLRCQLMETLELQKGMPDTSEGGHILLSDRPSIVFRKSCYPDFMPLIFFLQSTGVDSYLASFTWRRGKGSKVRVWIYSAEDETPVMEKEYAITGDPMVVMIVHVPHLHLLVTYCDDIHLRFFGDHTREFKLLSDMSSPYSITSMCSNLETGEVVTGAIGIVAFWSFVVEDVPAMHLVQEVVIASGEFVHFLRVEPERRALVALCENHIRVYDYQTKAQIRTFQVSQGVSLTCCSANWSQGFLYTGDLAGDIKVWDFDKGKQVSQFKAHLSAITSIISRTSVHTLMTASLDGLLKEWNLTTCEQLRRVDIGEPVFQMQFINEQTFFLRTKYTFSIRTVNNFYQLFNRSKSILKKLERVQCGPDKARILATTEDGVIRFLSPVTGEMLFVTWPFQLLEKALDYVYDPDREELLVTMGTNDIYVLDTTQNPCPAKYILRATDTLDDKVLCLAYSRLDLNGRTCSFIFTGYKSGKVRTVTQNLYRMGGRKIHDGNVVALSSLSASGNLSYQSRESSYLCSYGRDEHIVLSDVILKRNGFLEVIPLVAIPSINCRINNLLLIPGYICVLTEQNRVRLWRQAALVPGKKNPFWKESSAMHSTSITSFDYCHTLRILVTGGSDGSVRIWDILGQMLVEFDTTLKFSRVCFANQRGDLIVGCNMNIYFIPCITYLPSRHLSLLATRCLRDDVVERPLPFMPPFFLSFDIVFVPKYRQVGKQAKKFERLEPITNHKEVVIEKNVAKVVEFIGKEASNLPGPDFYGLSLDLKELHPEFAVEYQLIQQPSYLDKKHIPAGPPPAPPPYRGLPPLTETVPLLRRIPFQAGRSWPIAPDGYVPNSVIRARLFPKGTPTSLTCPLLLSRHPLPTRKMIKIQLPEWDKSEAVEKARKKKAQKMRRPSISEGHRRQDLLAEIVTKPWLRHKPSDTSLPCVIKAILNLMDDVPYSTYLLCTAALVQLSEAYKLPTPIQELAFDRLIQDTNHKEVRMRLAAWEALGKMDLLTDQEVVPLARALLDDHKKVRDLARSLLDSVAGITDKFVLKKEMQRLAETSLDDLVEMSRSQLEPAFPRRVRAAGIVAESHDAAVYALTEEAERLMNRVENQLTANLFLMTECPTLETQRSSRPPRFRRRAMSQAVPEESARPDSHLEAQARWLGLFARTDKLKSLQSQAAASATGKQLKSERLPRIQQARGKSMVLSSALPAPEGSPTTSSPSISSSESSSSLSSTSGGGTRTSSSSLRAVRRAKKEFKAKETRPDIKIPPSTLHETRKVPKAHKRAHPILLQRRDTRTQLYTEMLKHQKVKKDQAVATAPVEPKQEGIPVQAKPSEPLLPVLAPASVKGSFIDPRQQYSSDRSKWRNDLYKLMMLRISPFAEGRTAAEDFLASARIALAGRAMSWEAFTNISQSRLTSQEKVTAESAGWKKYMDELFKVSLKELKPSVESMETVLDVKKGRDWLRASESDLESSEHKQEELAKGRRRVDGVKRVREKELEPMTAVAEQTSVQEARKMMEREEKMARKLTKEGKVAKWKEHEAPLGKEQELLAKRKEHEAARGKEHEAAKGKEPEEAKRMEHEPPRGKEREAAGKRREREGPVERREKEAAKKKAGKAPEKRGEALLEAKGKFLEDKEGKSEPILWDIRRLRGEEALLTDPEKTLLRVRESTLAALRAEAKERTMAELKEQALAEAQKIALEEVRERALEEAREMALKEAKNWALLQARKMTLIETWEKVLAEAREKALEEVTEKALAEAQEKALAEIQEMELDEKADLKAIMAEKIRALTETKARELAEETATEMASGTALEVDEGRVLELARDHLAEVGEARILELAVARAKELAEARAMELAEEKMLELSESTIMELVDAKVLEMVEEILRELEMEEEKVKELEMVEEKLRELEMEEERLRELEMEEGEMVDRTELIPDRKELISDRKELVSGKKISISDREDLVSDRKEFISARKKYISDEEEAEMWEDLAERVQSVWSLSEDETEALITIYEKEPPSGADLELSDRAQLILDLLTEPEKLERKDSEGFQHLCQVVSLLQISSTTDAEGLAETLLQKAEETIKEGDEWQALLPGEQVSILAALKETIDTHESWAIDPTQLANRLKGILKAAMVVLKARKLKEQLERDFWSKRWGEREKKTRKAGEGKIKGKKAWMSKKLKDAIRKWTLEQEMAQWEKLEKQRKARRLRLRSQPVLLDASEKDKDEERPGGEEKAAEELEKQKTEQLARRKPVQLTWSLAAQRERAWKVIMQMEKRLPLPAEEPLKLRGTKAYRLPPNSLYLTTKPTAKIHRKKLRRGTRQHIFRLDDEKSIDWERFMNLYQSLTSLKEVEGGVDSAAWQEQSAKLLDLYGTSNPLIRTMMQQLLMGERHQRKHVVGSTVKLRKREADLGQRILYEMVHHSAWLRPKPPSLHGIIPLSYQNNVHPFKLRGVTRYGTLSFKWKTYLSKGKVPKLRLLVHSNSA